MSTALGSLVVNLEANIARFQSEMGRASQVTEQAMSRMQAASVGVRNVLGTLGVALSVDMIVGQIANTINALADLDDMAQKTGASVETLSQLSKVAIMTGSDFGAVDGAIVKLSKNLTEVDEKGNKTAKALSAIGISTTDIKNQDPAKLFVEVANKLQNYEDGAGKVALVTTLMGKSAADLLPYMNDVSENIDRFTGDSAAAAAAATKFQDDLGLLKVRYEEMKVAILNDALPAMTDFMGALMDTKREANSLTRDTSLNTWADDAAISLAKMADYATVTIRTLSALSSSVKVVVADIATVAAATPNNMALQVAQGKGPLDAFRAMMAEREKIIAAANTKWDAVLNAPVNALEDKVRARITARQEAEYYAGADGIAGAVAGAASAGKTRDPLNFSVSAGKAERSDAERATEEIQKLIAQQREQIDTFGLSGAAVLEYQLNLKPISAELANIAVANQQVIDKMKATEAAEKEAAAGRKKAQEDAARAQEQNAANVEQIRQSLMSEQEQEQLVHDTRMEQLRIYHDAKFKNVAEANALIEAETARHEQAKADLQASYEMQSLGMAGEAADQLYSLMERAGKEQTALGKAAFLASKAIAVAEIIMHTNVAAAKAGSQLGIFGIPMETMILATGYARAGMVAGMAIADASAEGGYDIPAGVNPLTQLHEKEMVLPKAHADVIRGLATRGGSGDGGGFKLTMISNGTPQRVVESRRIAPDEWAMIVEDAKNATAASFGDPNSTTSRAIHRNFNVQRSR